MKSDRPPVWHAGRRARQRETPQSVRLPTNHGSRERSSPRLPVAEIKKNERPDLKMVNFGQTRRSALLNLRLSGRGNELHGLANTVCFSYQREENTTHNERQFRQFLDAADHLGSHMRETFDLPFLKIVL